jgi:hypothetical protein
MSELKVTADHLKRDAYLYVRQSTLRQVAENGESTQRQYALRHRVRARERLSKFAASSDEVASRGCSVRDERPCVGGSGSRLSTMTSTSSPIWPRAGRPRDMKQNLSVVSISLFKKR